MKTINNRLLLGTLVAIALYWLAGLVTPNPYLSSAMSLTLLVSGSITAFVYAPQTYRVVFQQQRDTVDDFGSYSHLGVYGIMLLALGSCYVGLYGFLWVVLGQPDSWLGTATSGFGRAMMTAGFAMMTFSPIATRRVERMPNLVWLVICGSLALFLAFLAGTRMPTLPEDDSARFYRLHGNYRPPCPEDRPIWVGQGRAYHTPDSPYRDQVIPTRCYRTEKEAQAAGYRALKR
ncbi:hypothetical protein DEM27_10285 [Metarhizobium album]|uniref:Uncharacterized protein n=1 Tax=Metarhizobium album TaxID=2182425 RepID=A0A2U2DTW1_9HYPH|nr:hypothetical protein [Rhizobium album]PWE56742.1 hypothetical protein DEM27_10285 [Rhizobium album]